MVKQTSSKNHYEFNNKYEMVNRQTADFFGRHICLRARD
jgi:hypothetical protein